MGNLIYLHKCLGLKGKPIDIYKIRTMDINAHENLEEVINGSELDSLGKPLQDPRITPMGQALRKYGIDETFQWYNLARGDLKLVGIRPRSEKDWKSYPSEIMESSLKQKPGLIAIQYAYPYTESFEDNLTHMFEYLNEWAKNPIRTDREYLTRITRNMIWRGIRSR